MGRYRSSSEAHKHVDRYLRKCRLLHVSPAHGMPRELEVWQSYS